MPYRKYLLTLGVIGAFFVIAPMALATTTPATGASFVSMTQFPAFNTSASGGLSVFINSLYKYLIGIAAILAVLEITWGGFLWMGSGASVTSKEAGRNKIMMALTGLLLVLSPVIIFSIINPSVLSLKLGTNVIKITQPKPSGTTVTTPTTGCTLNPGEGSLLKKYTCAGTFSNSSATQYCTGNLSQATLTCSAKNSKGECATKTLYCSTKNKGPSLQAYEFIFKYSSSLGGSVGKETFFPTEVVPYNTFKNTCNSSGGVVKETNPDNLANINVEINANRYTTKEGLSSNENVSTHLFITPVSPFPCTNYPTNKLSAPKNLLDTYCFNVKLTCTPPPAN